MSRKLRNYLQSSLFTGFPFSIFNFTAPLIGVLNPLMCLESDYCGLGGTLEVCTFSVSTLYKLGTIIGAVHLISSKNCSILLTFQCIVLALPVEVSRYFWGVNVSENRHFFNTFSFLLFMRKPDTGMILFTYKPYF